MVKISAMSDAQSIPTGTGRPGVNEASETLAAVLVGRPDVETSLAVSEAIEILGDVQPPLPPLEYLEVGITVGRASRGLWPNWRRRWRRRPPGLRRWVRRSCCATCSAQRR